MDGVLYSGARLASPLLAGMALLTLITVLVAAVLISRGRLRSLLYAFSGALCLWMSAGLLVRGGELLLSGAAPRVSPALGFWGLPAASYILVDQARLPKGKGRGLLLALILLVPVAFILGGGRGAALSVYREWTARQDRFLTETLVHLRLFTTAVIAATVIGVPLGILAARDKRYTAAVISFVDGVQTIPSMALFGLLIAPLAALARAFPILRSLGISGTGAAPALIALTLYALLPITRNTVAGLAAVPDSAMESGRGMGMSSGQLFRQVRWPMALPYILAGLRTASVQAVGNTAVAALIGAGGLGIMIFQGLGQAAPDLILLGVIPLIFMALAVDRLWSYIIPRLVSPGLSPDVGKPSAGEQAA